MTPRRQEETGGLRRFQKCGDPWSASGTGFRRAAEARNRIDGEALRLLLPPDSCLLRDQESSSGLSGPTARKCASADRTPKPSRYDPTRRSTFSPLSGAGLATGCAGRL